MSNLERNRTQNISESKIVTLREKVGRATVAVALTALSLFSTQYHPLPAEKGETKVPYGSTFFDATDGLETWHMLVERVDYSEPNKVPVCDVTVLSEDGGYVINGNNGKETPGYSFYRIASPQQVIGGIPYQRIILRNGEVFVSYDPNSNTCLVDTKGLLLYKLDPKKGFKKLFPDYSNKQYM